MDGISLERVEALHPKLREDAAAILSEIDKATTTPTSFCRFACTLRTFEEQEVLYNQGRTTPGKVVTNAKPGFSYHNYGLAIDIAFVVNNKGSWDIKKDWDGDKLADWVEVVNIFKAHDWEWGDRGLIDLPHFQKVFGYKPKELLAKYNSQQVMFKTPYVRL